MDDFTQVQCTRCRNLHKKCERNDQPTGNGFAESVCPRCGGRSFYDATPQVAWCWASGLIEIGDAPPADSKDGGGCIVIAKGMKSHLESVLGALARTSRTGPELIVPGVPEAEGQKARANALFAWLQWCAKGNGKRHRHGVRFAQEGKPL